MVTRKGCFLRQPEMPLEVKRLGKNRFMENLAKVSQNQDIKRGGMRMKIKGSRKISKFLALLLLLTSFSSITSTAAEQMDPLQPYKEILAEFNEEKGTSYIMVSDEEELAKTNLTIQELVDFYTGMGTDAFRDYLDEIYMRNVDNPVQVEATVMGGQQARAEEFVQPYLYASSSPNFLYLKSKVVTVNNKAYYNSVVEMGEMHVDGYYPVYDLYATPTYKVSDDSTSIKVTYKYHKIEGPGISDLVARSINVTYFASEWLED